jgi:TP901 family phage tail tape measure protein
MLFSAATSNAVVSIGLDIYAVNNFSGPAAEAQKSLRATHNEFRRTMYENLRVARNVYGGLAAAGTLVARGMARTYKKFAEFDYVMKGTQIVTQATEEQFKQMRAEALRLGETTMFYADDIGNSMREMAKAGMPVEAVMSNIKAAVAGAGATMESLDITTRALISTMAQFQVPHQYATDVMDKLTAGALGSKSTVAQLSEALKYAAADFYALNIPMDTAIGMLMNVHNFGIEASMAGTSVGNALRYLSKSMSDMRTGRQTRAFEIFGINPEQLKTAQGDFKDMTEVFGIVSDAMTRLSTIDAQVAMEALFGIRGKRGVFPQTAAVDMLRKNIEKVANSAGMSEKYLGEMMETSEGGILKMISAFKTLQIVVGEALSPLFDSLTTIAKAIAHTLTALTGGKSGNWWNQGLRYVLSFGAGLLMLKTIIWGVKAAFATLAMMFGSNRISLHNMNQAMNTAWSGAKAHALGYIGIMDGVIARHVTLSNILVGGAAGSKRISTVTPIPGAHFPSENIYFDKGGRPRAYAPMSNIATRKKTYGGSVAPYSMVPGMGGMGKGAAKKGIGSALARSGMAGMLGKAGALMAGPWGIAALIGLPPLINLLSKSLKKNTDAVKDSTETQKAKGAGITRKPQYDEEFFNESRVFTNLLKRLEQNRELGKVGIPINKEIELIFNVDGENKFKKTLSSQQASQIFNMGL